MNERKKKISQLEIKNVYKIYRQGKIDVVALKDMNCIFFPGEISVIMGPSGCGKTTLINLIAGIDQVSSGKILLDEIDITQFTLKELDQFRKNNVGIVFQFFNLIPQYTTYENILLPLLNSEIPTKKRNMTVENLIELVSLENRKNHKPEELSGGQQQKVAFAIALATNPRILLCDEPTGELDSESKHQIYLILKKIIQDNPNKIIIIATHDSEMKNIADRLFVIKDGAISKTIPRNSNDFQDFKP